MEQWDCTPIAAELSEDYNIMVLLNIYFRIALLPFFPVITAAILLIDKKESNERGDQSFHAATLSFFLTKRPFLRNTPCSFKKEM